jgi:hypothetical protein
VLQPRISSANSASYPGTSGRRVFQPSGNNLPPGTAHITFSSPRLYRTYHVSSFNSNMQTVRKPQGVVHKAPELPQHQFLRQRRQLDSPCSQARTSQSRKRAPARIPCQRPTCTFAAKLFAEGNNKRPSISLPGFRCRSSAPLPM